MIEEDLSINPDPAKLIYFNFQPLEVVHRYRDPQPQVVENYSYSVKLNDLDLFCFHRAGQYNEVWGGGAYITLFSPSDVTALHRMKYGGRGCYITLFSPSDVTAFHRICLIWDQTLTNLDV